MIRAYFAIKSISNTLRDYIVVSSPNRPEYQTWIWQGEIEPQLSEKQWVKSLSDFGYLSMKLVYTIWSQFFFSVE